MHRRPSGSPRARRVLTAVVATAIVVAAAACLPPTTPDNRPSIPPGQSNGALPPELLATVSGCVVSRQAANSLREMLAEAAQANVSLWMTSCYRDLAGQKAARDWWCAQGACHMAAVPGTSSHGWGKAVDFGTSGGMKFDSPAYAWLKDRAWVYGWNHPGWAEPDGSAPEPWHWEWVGDGGRLYPGTTRGPQ
jgi:hypothetical protein